MKKLLLATALIMAAGMSSPADVYADEEVRVEHYEGEAIKNSAEAMDKFEVHNAEIATLLEKETLDDSDLEKIHEISYTLEAAIDKIREEGKAEEALVDEADEAIQAVHFASEKHEEATIREWFPKLTDAVSKMETAQTN